MKKKIILITTIVLLSFLIAAGCGNSSTNEQVDKDLIKIGVFPIDDMLPLIVGSQEGYFEEMGVKVELVPFQSAVEKESAFQSGSLDGIITDVIVAYLIKNSGVPVKITSLTTGVTPEEGPFGIVAAPDSEIKDLKDLQNKKIGISFNTIIEYVLDGLLAQQGFAENFAEKVSVAKIPVRMEMLMEGQLDAAILPEPFLSLAKVQGATLVADDISGDNLSQVVLLFQETFVDKNRDTLERFYKGYTKSVEAINGDPDKYHDLFVTETKVPEPVRDVYGVPMFPKPELPGEKEMLDVSDWLLKKGLLEQPIKYKDMIMDGLY